MAIGWNATTKQKVLGGTVAVAVIAVATMAIVAYCKSDNAEQTTNKMQTEVNLLAGQVGSVEERVDTVEERVDTVVKSTEQMRQEIQVLDGRVGNLEQKCRECCGSSKGSNPASSRPAETAKKPGTTTKTTTGTQGTTVRTQGTPAETPATSRPAQSSDTLALLTVDSVFVPRQDVQQYAADVVTAGDVNVGGDNHGVIVNGTNNNVTVLPDDYVKVTVQESCTVVFTKKAVRQMRRRCR